MSAASSCAEAGAARARPAIRPRACSCACWCSELVNWSCRRTYPPSLAPCCPGNLCPRWKVPPTDGSTWSAGETSCLSSSGATVAAVAGATEHRSPPSPAQSSGASIVEEALQGVRAGPATGLRARAAAWWMRRSRARSRRRPDRTPAESGGAPRPCVRSQARTRPGVLAGWLSRRFAGGPARGRRQRRADRQNSRSRARRIQRRRAGHGRISAAVLADSGKTSVVPIESLTTATARGEGDVMELTAVEFGAHAGIHAPRLGVAAQGRLTGGSRIVWVGPLWRVADRADSGARPWVRSRTTFLPCCGGRAWSISRPSPPGRRSPAACPRTSGASISPAGRSA